MKIKKIIICIALSLIYFAFIIPAQEPQRILVLDLLYNNGDIEIQHIQESFGFYPDRKIQYDSDHTLQMIGDDILYSFRFSDPAKVYTDMTSNNTHLQGGMMYINSTLFSIIVPYFDNVKRIEIKDNKNIVIAFYNFEKRKLQSEFLFKPFFLLFVILLFIIILYLTSLKKTTRK